jgi:predicted membrane-bound spermidine synthase
MTVRPVVRPRPAQDSDEITTLAGVLDFLRATVVNKVAGLSDEDARRPSAEPSTLTPASVVKHLSAVER